jgi:hypothetical protein
MSERSAVSAVPDNNDDDSPSATADHEASTSPAEAPDSETPAAVSPGTGGNDHDADDAAGSSGGGETASAADGREVSEPVTDSDATAVEPGASPAAGPESDSAVAQAAQAAASAAAAAARAAAEAAAAAAEAAEAAAAAAEAAEAAAVAANLAVTAIGAGPAGTRAAGATDDDVPEDADGETETGSDLPEDETFAEAEPRARGIAAWTADRRRDLLAYICVPLVTLFAVPALVLLWGIVILGNSTDSPAICDGVRGANGCEEATWVVIRVHVVGFLGLWALLWAVPWRQGLRTPRVLLALAAGLFLFAGLLRLAA